MSSHGVPLAPTLTGSLPARRHWVGSTRRLNFAPPAARARAQSAAGARALTGLHCGRAVAGWAAFWPRDDAAAAAAGAGRARAPEPSRSAICVPTQAHGAPPRRQPPRARGHSSPAASCWFPYFLLPSGFCPAAPLPSSRPPTDHLGRRLARSAAVPGNPLLLLSAPRQRRTTGRPPAADASVCAVCAMCCVFSNVTPCCGRRRPACPVCFLAPDNHPGTHVPALLGDELSASQTK